MFVYGYKEWFSCVADVDYENNNQEHILLVNFDGEYVNNLLQLLTFFWNKKICPLLYKTTENT